MYVCVCLWKNLAGTSEAMVPVLFITFGIGWP